LRIFNKEALRKASGDVFGKMDVPDDESLQGFHQKVQGNFKLIKILLQQNTQLRQARNIFLPKLMSGEIDVAEEIMPVNVVSLQFTEGMVAENGVPF
jgi:hypothetical protein